MQYRKNLRASFTICVNNRAKIFVDPKLVFNFIKILQYSCKKFFCDNWAYVFMPDHVHIVLEGTRIDSDCQKAIILFKQKTGYWFAKNMPTIQWQKSFYDHIHRSEHELINHILYVVNNPVRKFLVDKWNEYPFTGSLDNDLNVIVLN